MMNIAQNVVRASKLFPGNMAMVFEGEKIDYALLEARTNRVANALEGLGVRRGDRIALFLPNIPAFAYVYLGALKLGAIAVSINASLKPKEVDHILTDSGAKVLATVAALRENVPADRPAALESVLIAEGEAETGERSLQALMDEAAATPRLADMGRDEPAAILYTSGTTGFPKGATLSHGNVISNVHSFNYNCRMRPDDRMMLYLPLFHCFGQNAIMNSAFNMAATLILQRGFKPDDARRAIVEEGATVFFGVPTTFMPVYERVSPEEMANVRYFFSAAAILPLEIAEKWRKKYGREVNEGYGLTETSPFASYNHILRFKPGSIGAPIENVAMKVVDEQGGEVAPGELGEIVISGPNVMLGYWNRPDDTAKAIRDGWFHSGDIGRMDEDGYFFIVDRVKDMINVGGLKVYPAEVEAILYQHPDVVEAAVYGGPDPVMGERVMAAVALRPDADATPEALMAFCRERIAAFKVPKDISLVDKLPKNPVGKLLKRVLRDEAATAAPAPAGNAAAAPAVGRSAREIKSWIEAWLVQRLCLKPDEVKAGKTFVDYGVDSMLAVDLAKDLGDWLGRKLEPIIVWNFSNPQALAQHIHEKTVGKPAAETPAPAAPVAANAEPALERYSDDEMAELLAKELELSQDRK